MKSIALTLLAGVALLTVALPAAPARADERALRISIAGRGHRDRDAVVVRHGRGRGRHRHDDHCGRGRYDRHHRRGHGRRRSRRAPDAVVIQPPVAGHPPVVIEHPRVDRGRRCGYIRPIYRRPAWRTHRPRRLPYCGRRPLYRGRSGSSRLSFSLGW